jgi:flavoprotein
MAAGDDSVGVILCADWPDSGYPQRAAPGTVRRQCHACMRAIQLSPSGVDLQRRHGAVLSCGDCARLAAPNARPAVHPQTRAELQQVLGVTGREVDAQTRRLADMPLAELVDAGTFKTDPPPDR